MNWVFFLFLKFIGMFCVIAGIIITFLSDKKSFSFIIIIIGLIIFALSFLRREEK
jgi:ABC-type Mn2+/Zn2+ transport system permease subunit